MRFLLGLVPLAIVIFALSRAMNFAEISQIEKEKNKKANTLSSQCRNAYLNARKSDVYALTALLRSIVYQFESYVLQREEENNQRFLHERRTLMLLAMTALFTFGADVIFYWQWTEMSKSGEDTRRMAEANRAWVFIEYIGHEPTFRTIGNPYFIIHANLKIINYGQSPAIIDGVEPYLFVADAWGNPDPGDPAMEKYRSYPVTNLPSDFRERQMPVIRPPTPFGNSPLPMQAQYILGTGKFISNIGVDFSFNRIEWKDEPNGFFYWVKKWLFVLIKYTDIYGAARETSYYARVSVLGDERVPSELDKKYNYIK